MENKNIAQTVSKAGLTYEQFTGGYDKSKTLQVEVASDLAELFSRYEPAKVSVLTKALDSDMLDIIHAFWLGKPE